MMLKRLTISLLAVAGMMGIVSCVSDNFTECPEPSRENAPMVNLTFSVVAPSTTGSVSSRAQNGTIITIPDDDNYFGKEDSKFELIHTLRVIIVRPNTNIVEHNKKYILSDAGAAYYDDMNFLVEGNETKRIILFANEEGVTNTDGTPFDFDQFKEGTAYNGSIVAGLQLNAAPNGVLIDNTQEGNEKFIPMCEEHRVFVKEPLHPEDYDQIVEVPLFMTRAAVKFSFTFEAEYGEGIYLQDLTLNGVANTEYFMPNNTVYSPAKGLVTSLPFDGFNRTPDDRNGHFITSYDVPGQATVSPIKFDFSDKPIALTTSPVEFSPALYFCETKKVVAGSNTPYTANITILTQDVDGNLVDPYTFDDVALPNLPILPRNTHVLVHVKLTGADIACEVELVPYKEVVLTPSFGFDELNPGNN